MNNPPLRMSTPPGVVSYSQRVLSFWRSGAVVALVVAFGLPAWWRISSNLYEAQLTLEVPPAAGAGTAASPADPAAEQLTRLEKLLGSALEREWKNALALAPRSAPVLELRKLSPTQHALICRGPSPEVATQRCSELAQKALEQGGPLTVLPSKEPPSRAITFARLPVFLVGSGFGLFAGALWMLVAALFVARQRSQPLNASTLIPSSIPPERAVSEPPPGEWRFTVWPPAEGAPAGSSSTLQPICDDLTMRAGERCFVVGVTSSPESRVRKARVAAQLAIELSEERSPRVLLLEADFEEPAVELTMRVAVPPLAGFSQQLHLRDEPVQHASWAVVHCNSHLNVLAEGRVRVPGMLHSERFSQALSQLRLDYDVIVIDGPPIGNVTDARALDAVTDGIVFVAASTAHAAGTHNAASKWFGSKRMSRLVLTDPSNG